MKKFILVCVFLFSFCSHPLLASEPMIHKTRLDNGLTVIVNEMPAVPVVAIYAWVKTGSANEGEYMGSGVTHFVEHMLFKGTARRAAGAIPEEAKAMGGLINASTGYDHTVFTLSVPRENFAKGLDLIADMVQNAAMDAQELERERAVILKEMRMINDKPDRKLDNLVSASVYQVHPYKNPIIGYEDIFSALTRDEVADYYHTFYVPNNMILTVSGGVTAEEILPQIKKAFADFKPKSFPLRTLPQEPEQIFSRWIEEQYATDLLRLVMAYQGVPLLSNDVYALDVLAMALGSGESSRLYLDLYKNKRLVESIGSSNYTPQDKGYFEISCLSSRDNAREIVDAVKAQIEDVKKRGFSKDELEKIKRQVMMQNIYSRETAESMAYRTGIEEAYTGDHLFSDKYLEGVRRVTNEDIKRVASQYLVDGRLTVVALKPKVKTPIALPQASDKKGETEKIVLSNGLVLLLKEDKRLPLVALNVVIGGGIRQEPPEKNGLSQLTAMTWDKGAGGKTSDDISREVESRGASLSVGAGRNTFVMTMNGFSGDMSFFLDQIEDLIKRPAFLEDEIHKQKDQMLTAIKGRKDSIMQTSMKALRETLFLKHPFRLDGYGTEETLARIQRADLVSWYERFLAPNNMVVAVFGDIDKAKVRAECERRFGVLKTRPVSLSNSDEPFPGAARLKELEMEKEQAVVLYGLRSPDIYEKDRYAVEVAVNILSSSLGGRMFRRIRDELGKAYTLGGSYGPGVDAGMTTFYVLTTNENIDKVRVIVEEELKNLREIPVSAKELEDAKSYLKGDQARDLEAVSALAGTSSVDEFLGLGFDHYKGYDARIDALTKEDIQAAARRYFDPAHGAVVITRSTIRRTDGKNRE